MDESFFGAIEFTNGFSTFGCVLGTAGQPPSPIHKQLAGFPALLTARSRLVRIQHRVQHPVCPRWIIFMAVVKVDIDAQ